MEEAASVPDTVCLVVAHDLKSHLDFLDSSCLPFLVGRNRERENRRRLRENQCRQSLLSRHLHEPHPAYSQDLSQWEQNSVAHDPFLKTNSLLLEANEKVQLRSVGRETFSEVSVGQAEFAVLSDEFSVFNLNEELLFRVTNDSLHVKHTTIHVENGVRLNASLQTPLVRGGNRLLLESPLGRVVVSSPGPALVESRTGDVYLVAHSNITLKSKDQLYFDSADIRLRGILPEIPNEDHFAYPLCICSSGKLFLGDADNGTCSTEQHC